MWLGFEKNIKLINGMLKLKRKDQDCNEGKCYVSRNYVEEYKIKDPCDGKGLFNYGSAHTSRIVPGFIMTLLPVGSLRNICENGHGSP